MARPRVPFGAPAPGGRIPATMLRVLAAELTDTGRLGRGRDLHREGAVVDIGVEPGRLSGLVQGSRAEPYAVEVRVRPGDGLPTRRHLHAVCTCPDVDPCKHVVALLLALAVEVEIEPAVVTRWRSGAPDADTAWVEDEHGHHGGGPVPDPLADLLAAGGALPAVPTRLDCPADALVCLTAATDEDLALSVAEAQAVVRGLLRRAVHRPR